MQRISVPPSVRTTCPDELQLTRAALIHYNPDSHACQRCGKRIWHSGKASSYRRGITYIKDGKRVDEEVLVPVCLCRKCGKSSRRGGNASGDYCHAILPDSLIPFTYYTLLFVLTVLDAYAKRTQPVAALCRQWGISVSTLYRWKERYQEHYDAWAGSLERIRALRARSTEPDPEAGALRLSLRRAFQHLAALPSSFFLRFGFSFLQPNRLTHFRPLPAGRRP